jgi:signal peptidase I
MCWKYITGKDLSIMSNAEEQDLVFAAEPDQSMAAPNDPSAPATKKPEEPENFALEFYNWIHELAVCLAFVTIFFVFFVRLVGVKGPSMTPTLLDGDRVALLSNFFYHDVENGDVVVMRVPTYDDGESAIVKRVIATEGQTVDIDFDAGTVTVDGVVLDEPYINEQMTWPTYYMEWEYPITVPEGCIFVMGDNRNHSADSRYPDIGMVDTRYVLGKVVATLWPLNQIGVVK